MEEFEQEISRNRFLKSLLKLCAASTVMVSSNSCDAPDESNSEKTREQLTPLERQTINAIARAVLNNGPLANFDAGAALNDYLFLRPEKLPFTDNLRLLLILFDSRLAALLLDFSLTPVCALEPDECSVRLMEWKRSELTIKAAAYKAIRQLCLLLSSSQPELIKLIGYRPLEPYRG